MDRINLICNNIGARERGGKWMASTIENTLVHALFFSRHLKYCDLPCVVVAVLMELGVPTKTAGFDYLKTAILVFMEDQTQMVTKDLYPTVAKAYTSKPGYAQIEKGIRRAISEAWARRDNDIWKCYFSANKDGNIEKPTNAEFISRIARFIELWQGCCKEVNDG